MTITKKGLLLGAGAVLALAGFATVSFADGGWGRHGRGHHGGFGAGLFEAYDANGDSRLTQAEIDQVRQSRLSEFDRDGDGSLSLEEYQALWMDAMRERMVDRFQGHDDDGDGMVTSEEFAEPLDRMVSRLDDNDDGEVTMDEIRRRHRDRDEERD
jgi:Ca2+-binding EF-hand superfamily protein